MSNNHHVSHRALLKIDAQPFAPNLESERAAAELRKQKKAAKKAKQRANRSLKRKLAKASHLASGGMQIAPQVTRAERMATAQDRRAAAIFRAATNSRPNATVRPGNDWLPQYSEGAANDTRNLKRSIIQREATAAERATAAAIIADGLQMNVNRTREAYKLASTQGKTREATAAELIALRKVSERDAATYKETRAALLKAERAHVQAVKRSLGGASTDVRAYAQAERDAAKVNAQAFTDYRASVRAYAQACGALKVNASKVDAAEREATRAATVAAYLESDNFTFDNVADNLQAANVETLNTPNAIPTDYKEHATRMQAAAVDAAKWQASRKR